MGPEVLSIHQYCGITANIVHPSSRSCLVAEIPGERKQPNFWIARRPFLQLFQGSIMASIIN